jgi:glutathione S-transferase
MKLYLAPGACSLATHIALHEAGLPFDRVTVDLKTRRTEDGGDYTAVNPKGYVPTLEFDDGRRLTENVAILDSIAHRCPKLGVEGEDGRTRLLEMLAFISTEIHKQFGRVFRPSSDAEKSAAFEKIDSRYAWLAQQLKGDFLFGAQPTVADAYLYVTLAWAEKFGHAVPEALNAYKGRMDARPAVQLSLRHEGLVPA